MDDVDDVNVIEEDWSDILCGGVGGSDSSCSFYRSHNMLKIDLRCPSRSLECNRPMEDSDIAEDENWSMKILSVPCLTPLDMVGLSHGCYDATGNRIWTGAIFFVEAFGRCYDTEDYSILNSRILNLRKTLFQNKLLVELGCGTGLSSISLLKQPISTSLLPRFVLFTDGDESSLDLCKRNCDLNFGKNTTLNCNSYGFSVLKWGSKVCASLEEAYDTVIATDVLYDLGALDPLFRSAYELLKPGSYFILSHIPRTHVEDCAKLADGTSLSSNDTLERMIHEQAKDVGFRINACNGTSYHTIIRPNDLATYESSSTMSEYEQVGASIMIFQK